MPLVAGSSPATLAIALFPLVRRERHDIIPILKFISSCSVVIAQHPKGVDPFESEERLSGTDRVRCWSTVI